MTEREAIIDFCNAMEAACVNLRMKLGDKPTDRSASNNNIAVNELTFTTLKFESMQGEKLGSYEIAYKPNNINDKFSQAYNILKASNATIKSRYHGKTYQFSYWIYGEDKIYRKKLEPKQ